MKMWIAGTRYERGGEWFLFGAFKTEQVARATAEKYTHKGATPLLFECELGKAESAGLMECYEPASAE